VRPSKTCESICADAESEIAAGSQEAVAPAARTMSLSTGRERASSSDLGVTMKAASRPAATMMRRSPIVPIVATLGRRPALPSAVGLGSVEVSGRGSVDVV
jgi:hypothetical protein